MKNYGALRFISGILKFLGWLIIIASIFVLLIGLLGSANIPRSPYTSPTGIILVMAAIAFGVFLSGILTVACGELIDAVVDIAMNSAQLRNIAHDAQRTVAFFDHMSGKANGRRSDGTVQTNASIP
jgi:hypothetical protein